MRIGGLSVLPCVHAPVFSGAKATHTDRAQRKAWIEQKLAGYQAGWRQLLQWDKTAHSVPVFRQVNLPGLLTSARAFLERQAGRKPSETAPFLIGVTGGSASGKTTVKKEWLRMFNREAGRQIGWRKKQDGPIIDDIDLDNYYRNFSERRKALGDAAFFQRTNLDHPDALTLNEAARDVFRIRNGKAVRTPKIHYATSSRQEGALYKSPAPFFIVEGLFALAPKSLRNLLDMKIFVAADAETRKQRWWQRAPERNVKGEAAQNLFNRTMRMHDAHVEPVREVSDVVINGAAPLAEINEAMKRLTRLMLKTFAPKQTLP